MGPLQYDSLRLKVIKTSQSYNKAMNKALTNNKSNAIKDRFKAYFQINGLFQLVIYGTLFIVLMLLIINYPANMPNWRYFGTVIALVTLLILNILWFNSPLASERQRLIQDWTFLILSTGLILTITLLSANSAWHTCSRLCASRQIIDEGFGRPAWYSA